MSEKNARYFSLHLFQFMQTRRVKAATEALHRQPSRILLSISKINEFIAGASFVRGSVFSMSSVKPLLSLQKLPRC